jgi:hypothetical protein
LWIPFILILFCNPSASEKILANPRSRRAKRKEGVGKMNFCPPAFRAEGAAGVGADQFRSK